MAAGGKVLFHCEHLSHGDAMLPEQLVVAVDEFGLPYSGKELALVYAVQPGTLLPVITGKRRYGSALSVKTRHGNILVSERRDAGGTELFFHNLITQFVGMLH